MSSQILHSINSEKCQISSGPNSNKAGYSSVDCQSSIMVRVEMRAPTINGGNTVFLRVVKIYI